MSSLRIPRTWLVALVALLTGIGVIAGPAAFAAGSSVSNVTFTSSSNVAGATASWTIGFTTSNGSNGALGSGSTITVSFNSSFSEPAGPAVTLGTGFSSCTASASTAPNTDVVTVTLAGSGCTHAKNSTAALTLAGITNAPVGTYPANTFSVATSGDTNPVSPAASIGMVIGPGSQLAFTTQPPATGTEAVPLATFKVSIEDAGGNIVTTATDPVTLQIGSGPSGGAFSSAQSTYTNVAAVSGVATFSGVALNLAGTYTLTAVGGSLTSTTSTSVVIGAGAGSKLAFVQGPSNGFAGTALTPAITVQVQDQNGNAVSASGVVVTLTPSAGVIDSGATATTNSSGRATFSSVVINTAALGLTLTASANNLTSTAASTAFNVTVAVSSGAVLTDTTSDGSGSGVKAVAYYYCAGYSGTCTSANWTLIGSSTTASSYQVTWTSTPAPGAYRVVAVSTDNLTNVSQPSSTTPVTVS